VRLLTFVLLQKLRNLLSSKWWTGKEFYFECDNLRNRYTDEKDEKKLKFLDEINEFVEGIQKKYEQA
jgi:exodeoxyribonuclease-1